MEAAELVINCATTSMRHGATSSAHGPRSHPPPQSTHRWLSRMVGSNKPSHNKARSLIFLDVQPFNQASVARFNADVLQRKVQREQNLTKRCSTQQWFSLLENIQNWKEVVFKRYFF
mmetsp:Transcript_23778/g.42935  ORF Transcript_23778/g.42935 Transcript_23778/m.42935 type:complete len:117 (-) Transcript_23778:2067-2417(-)